MKKYKFTDEVINDGIVQGNVVLYHNKMFYVRKVVDGVIEGYKISDSLVDLFTMKNAINLNHDFIDIDINDDELLILDNNYCIKIEDVEKVLGYADEKLKKQVDDSVGFLKDLNLINKIVK